MADFGFSIAENLVEVTASRVIKEVCEIWNYKSQLEQLKQTVCTIRSVLFDAESQREELSHGARGYIANLKAAVYDADDLFDELNTLAELKRFDDERCKKVVCCFFCSKIKGVSEAHRMLRGVKDIKKRLDVIASNNIKFGLRGNVPVPMNAVIRRGPRREETCSYVGEKIIGRDGDREEVIHMLGLNDVQESFRVVTIVGVGGLGKTTLAQLVYNNEKVQAEFPEFRLWVCVSDEGGQEFDVKVILCKILELISDQNLADTSPMELVNNQLQEKLGGRKYLLFLDDVWNEDPMKWRNLRKFLTIGQKGSRIVVTTRSVKTAEVIGKRHIHMLKGLSEEDSWDLFESVAFNKEEQEHINHPDPDLVTIGKKIVEKCSNIPLAIKAVGSLLNGEPVEKWQTIEQTIEHSGLGGIGNGDNSIMPILKLSYDSLSPSLKSCFSYCALFPKDFSMMKEQLINLWMAQGYIVPFHSGETMEDAAEEHFMMLLRRCFFQDVKKNKYGDIKSVKIHDLMHDVALEVGREEIGVVSSNITELGDKVRHVYYAGESYSQSYPFKSKIRSFILTSSLFQVGDMKDASLDSWMRVRVLVLKGPVIVRLPDSIGKLLHLRYLDLSVNGIEALPSCITTLHNLQTLDLNSCWKLRELPKEINELIKLRYLYLFKCGKLSNMPCMDKLTNLRYLCLSHCDELSSIPSMDKWTNLRYLNVSECKKLTNMPCMDKLVNLRHLDLSDCGDLSSIPLGMDKLTNLRYLDLSLCWKLTNMPCMDKLTNLRHFNLIYCHRLISSMPSGMGKLSNLRVLPLFVVGMEKRVSSDGEEQCMGELKDLKPLTSLEGSIEIKIGKYYVNDDGEGGYLKGMNHLTKVEIDFNHWYDEDNERIEWEGVIEKLEPPSNLKKFILKGYEGKTIPRWGRAQDNWALSLPHLVEIDLFDCKKLEQIPLLSRLRNLKSLSVRRLQKLEYMENKSSNNGNALEDLTTFFPSLETLYIYKLDSLKGWWREEELVNKVEDDDDDDDDDLILKSSFTFPRLSKLDIIKCPNVTSFPSCPSLKNIAIGDLGLLKSVDSQCLITSLDIKYNEKVESLSEFGDVFRKYTSSFRSLTISDCSNLRRLGRGGLEHLTALEELKFYHNDQLSFSEDEVDDEDMPWRSLPLSLHSLNFDSLKNMKSLPKGMQYLTSLRSLSIDYCKNISGLPEWISCLSSLQSLSIQYCFAFKSLPESMRNLTSLQKLEIIMCTDELKESCKQPNGKDWLNIQHIPNIKIY